MVGEVLQSGLDAPVVLAGHEDEPVGGADVVRQFFEGRGGLALRILLVHPVEHRKVDRLGVDQLDVIPPLPEPLDDELGKADAHPVDTIGAVEDKDSVAHCCHSRAGFGQRAVHRPSANRR
jgi:hypothetical protein